MRDIRPETDQPPVSPPRTPVDRPARSSSATAQTVIPSTTTTTLDWWRLLRLIFVIQGLYYAITGLWPLLARVLPLPHLFSATSLGTNFNGTGNSKYPDLKAEFSQVPYKRGIVGMARKGNSNDSGNSQFFITFTDASFLNGQYTVVGEVLSGMDVVDKLKKGDSNSGSVPDPDRMLKVQVAADAK